MDGHEAGKQIAEQFVRGVVKSLTPDGHVDAFLWWLASPPTPGGAAGMGAAPLALRMYRGNSWRSVEFAASDIDGSVEKPDVLKKYEGEIAQSLLEL